MLSFHDLFFYDVWLYILLCCTYGMSYRAVVEGGSYVGMVLCTVYGIVPYCVCML
jgi:hypothetical protein